MPASFIRRCKPLLGTYVEVVVPDAGRHAIDAAFAAIAHVQSVMSFHEETSDLARLRRTAPGGIVSVDPATVAVLRLAARFHRRSGGLFDIGCGRALVTAGFLPWPDGVSIDRMDGNAGDIEILDGDRVRCHRPVLIDLGGIAKGYAVDSAIEALRRAGVRRALVNAGGDLRVLGEIDEPIHLRAADGAIAGSLALADMALATSSNLDRRRSIDGGISVPHRGRWQQPLPIDHAVSIVAPACAIADAMTKIAIADRRLAIEMLDELGGAIVDLPPDRLAA